MYLVGDRMQVVNHLQRDQRTLDFKGKTQGGRKLQKQQTKKNAERENAEIAVGKKHKKRIWARLKRGIRTNSVAISMSKVEASTMAESVSTKKKKKKKNSKSTEPGRTTTIHGFQIREVELRFAQFIEFFIYTGFWG